MNKLQISKVTLRNLLLGAYILCVIGFSVASRAEVGTFPMPVKLPPGAQVVELVGEVVVDESGAAHLVQHNRFQVRLEVPANLNVDLTTFEGQVVYVVGAYVTRNIQPVIAEAGHVVTDGDARREMATPTVFVLKISGSEN